MVSSVANYTFLILIICLHNVKMFQILLITLFNINPFFTYYQMVLSVENY